MKKKSLFAFIICALIIGIFGSQGDLIIFLLNEGDLYSQNSGIDSEVSTNSESRDNLRVHVLDVGQADSIFIELPNNETMLIDAGNNSDDEFVVKYIENLNYDTINYVVGTHPHEDHIGGLDTVIDSFKIENIYMPKIEYTTKTFKDVLLSIQNKNLKIKTAKGGVDILNFDDFKIKIIAPVSDKYEEINNYSAVVKIDYMNNSFLFMGDAEILSEEEIKEDVKADVIKIGHHGSSSSTSNEFLTKVSPYYAIISVGMDNDYGHPSDNVLDMLNNNGIDVYRTDELGNIVITSDGTNIEIK